MQGCYVQCAYPKKTEPRMQEGEYKGKRIRSIISLQLELLTYEQLTELSEILAEMLTTKDTK